MGRSPSPSASSSRRRRDKDREREKRARKRSRERDREHRGERRQRSRGERERERERDRDRSKDRDRSRERVRRSRSSSYERDRSNYPTTSRSSKSAPERPTITEADLEGKSPDEQEMMRTMGFCGFDTTKNKKVDGNDAGEVHVILKRKYRQYMNRKGGFNRPLDFVA